MKTTSTGPVCLLIIAVTNVSWTASNTSQAIFSTPDEAANALVATLESDDYSAFLSVAGPQMAGFWNAGEPERDAFDRDRLAASARRDGIRAEAILGDRRLFYVGRIQQPFPAPLVRANGGWRFDDEAGSREVAARRIRRNEVAAIEICQRFREAEYAYFEMAPQGNRVFAEKIRSTPGQQDGLVWSSQNGEDESPMGPSFAAAAFAERGPADGTRPLFGYYFKILSEDAEESAVEAGGDTAHDGWRRGFALIAWPAEYGVDGAQSFLINHAGYIYQKDLGADTAGIAQRTTAFNPDGSWKTVDVGQ